MLTFKVSRKNNDNSSTSLLLVSLLLVSLLLVSLLLVSLLLVSLLLVSLLLVSLLLVSLLLVSLLLVSLLLVSLLLVSLLLVSLLLVSLPPGSEVSQAMKSVLFVEIGCSTPGSVSFKQHVISPNNPSGAKSVNNFTRSELNLQNYC